MTTRRWWFSWTDRRRCATASAKGRSRHEFRVDAMNFGIVLFTSDRGITPADAAKAAEQNGFTTFYVPEHSHLPIKRQVAHPTTGDASLPDDRYMRTLDPWVSLATVCAVTTTIRLSTAVCLPVQHD